MNKAFYVAKTHNKNNDRRISSFQWRDNGRDGVPNHQPHDFLFNRLFRRRSNKTSKLRVTPVTGEFPAQMASYAENISIWWRHHGSQLKNQDYTNGVFKY